MRGPPTKSYDSWPKVSTSQRVSGSFHKKFSTSCCTVDSLTDYCTFKSENGESLKSTVGGRSTKTSHRRRGWKGSWRVRCDVAHPTPYGCIDAKVVISAEETESRLCWMCCTFESWTKRFLCILYLCNEKVTFSLAFIFPLLWWLIMDIRLTTTIKSFINEQTHPEITQRKYPV